MDKQAISKTSQEYRKSIITDIQYRAILMRVEGRPYTEIGRELDRSPYTIGAWMGKPHIRAKYLEMLDVMADEVEDVARTQMASVYQEVARIALEGTTESNRLKAAKMLMDSFGRVREKSLRITGTVKHTFLDQLRDAATGDGGALLLEEEPVDFEVVEDDE